MALSEEEIKVFRKINLLHRLVLNWLRLNRYAVSELEITERHCYALRIVRRVMFMLADYLAAAPICGRLAGGEGNITYFQAAQGKKLIARPPSIDAKSTGHL